MTRDIGARGNRVMARALPRMKGKSLFFFSDFDGTLVPIRRDPEKVILSKRIRATLEALLRKMPVAIISGRSLAYLQKIIPKGIILAGNHGLEIQMNDGGPFFFHPEAVSGQAQIRQLAQRLRAALYDTGTLIEEKGLTLTFHYRTVTPRLRESVCKTFYETVTPLPRSLRIHKGKLCLEVRPNINWGKKEAILWILESYPKAHPEKPVFPIYIGDDETDKKALAWARTRGMALFRGERTLNISATDFIVSQEELIHFIKSLTVLGHR